MQGRSEILKVHAKATPRGFIGFRFHVVLQGSLLCLCIYIYIYICIYRDIDMKATLQDYSDIEAYMITNNIL